MRTREQRMITASIEENRWMEMKEEDKGVLLLRGGRGGGWMAVVWVERSCEAGIGGRRHRGCCHVTA
jgi:hypothetical protein